MLTTQSIQAPEDSSGPRGQCTLHTYHGKVGGRIVSGGPCTRQGSLPFQTPVVKAGICSGAGAGVGDRRAVNLQIAEGGRAPLNEDIFFRYMWTGECWVTVIKGSQGPGTSSSHSHENTSSGKEEENCEGNAHDDKRESLFSPIFKKPEHFRQRLF